MSTEVQEKTVTTFVTTFIVSSLNLHRIADVLIAHQQAKQYKNNLIRLKKSRTIVKDQKNQSHFVTRGG